VKETRRTTAKCGAFVPAVGNPVNIIRAQPAFRQPSAANARPPDRRFILNRSSCFSYRFLRSALPDVFDERHRHSIG